MGTESKKSSKSRDAQKKADKSPSGGSKHEKKDKYKSDKNERKRKKDEDTSNVGDDESPTKKIKTAEDFDSVGDQEGAGGSGGGEISLSIEETNKLREKLGLAPLQIEDKTSVREVVSEDGKTTDSVYKVDGVEFVHKPAENWADKKAAETLREKLAAHKEKRKIQEKLTQLKTLDAPDDKDDSAAAWVQKSRRLDEEKQLALQRAKVLEEMDKDFGVADIVESHVKKSSEKKYSSKDLKGMTVEHSLENFLEGHETVLVLKDKDVLDESDETLINPTLVDHDKWKKNVELRKSKPGYDPFDEEFDQFGNLKEKKLLGKYDETIEGEQRETFKLDDRGSVDVEFEKMAAERMKTRLREGMESLDVKPAQLAAEFYTAEEMSKFKKPKKKVKKIRGSTFKVDDLMFSANATNEDYGSRSRGKGRKKADHENPDEVKSSTMDVDEEKLQSSSLEKLKQSHAEAFNDEEDDLSTFVVEDEAETELQSILHRTRLVKQIGETKSAEWKNVDAEKIAARVRGSRDVKKEESDGEDETVEEKPVMILNTVSEYCRGLGDIPTYGLAGNRDDVDPSAESYFDDAEDAEMDADNVGVSNEDAPTRHKRKKGGKWIEAEFDEQDRLSTVSSSDSSEEFDTRPPILEEEPEMSKGVAFALQQALKKGYLEKGDNDDHGPSKLAHLEAQRFTIVDKQFHDIDDKYAKKLERMGGYGGPVTEFKEKSTYQPNIKLQYPDEKGNLMDAKGAFRYQSWKFHGKVPGKRKVEKRTKKLKEKQLMNQMSATDTPLGTLEKQVDKQRQLQLPYIVLSGAGSKDVGTAIKKE